MPDALRTHHSAIRDELVNFGRCIVKKPHGTIKRAFDIVSALTGVVLTSPFLIASIVWVKIKDPGPALFKQWRVGKDGRLFKIYKLRTMVLDAENGTKAVLAKSDDERVIAGCRWMRKSHVDELPQFWNILKGDMSLVGPRPERPEILEEYTIHIPTMTDRLKVKPGLTGLAQIRNGYSADVEGMKRKYEYDMEYIESHSVVEDIKIVLGTLPKVWDRSAN